jgi:hypothetical protein
MASLAVGAGREHVTKTSIRVFDWSKWLPLMKRKGHFTVRQETGIETLAAAVETLERNAILRCEPISAWVTEVEMCQTASLQTCE